MPHVAGYLHCPPAASRGSGDQAAIPEFEYPMTGREPMEPNQSFEMILFVLFGAGHAVILTVKMTHATSRPSGFSLGAQDRIGDRGGDSMISLTPRFSALQRGVCKSGRPPTVLTVLTDWETVEIETVKPAPATLTPR
jgi:hypothetical protein